MNFSPSDVDELRGILALCKTVGIDGCVLAGGKVMGAMSNKKVAIISETKLSIDPAIPVGIGRLSDLEKRLGLFSGPVSITGDVAKNGEIGRMTIAAGKTKAQFRCSATSMVLHPKENQDPGMVVVTMSKAEVSTLTKAAKIFGAETIIFKISSAGDVHIECVDSTNDQFSTGTEKPAEFIDEAETILFTYAAPYLNTVLDVGVRDLKRDDETIDLVFGQAGSITTLVKGYSLLVMNEYNED
jgi:hypothetical protein